MLSNQTLRLLAVATLMAAATNASAQSFNLDVGANQTYPLPTNAYGAAANQPGVWFGVGTTAQIPVSLNDLSGASTSVSITPTGGFGDFAVGNPAWNGDDQQLMEDATDVGGVWQGAPGGSISWALTGLNAGTYEIYTYAAAPDFPATYSTRVAVTGAVEGAQICNGAWAGSPHVQGVTFAKHTITIAAGASITIVTDDPGTFAQNLATVNGFQIKQTGGSTGGTGTPFCFGDGSGTACPCVNNSAVGDDEGCLNSLGTGGRLRGTGSASLFNDTLVLLGTRMPNSSCLYFQGTTQAGVPAGSGSVFGDGKRCAGGSVIRLGTKTNSAGASQYPDVGDASVSVKGLVTSVGTRTYQAWYRNGATFCTVSTFNLSNGLDVLWQP